MADMQSLTGLPFDLPLWSCKLEPGSRVTIRTRGEVERCLVTRALRDLQFRMKLLAEPKPLVEAELGMAIPGSLQMQVLEESEAERYVVLPSNPLTDTLSLNWSLDEAADWVLGGRRTSLMNAEQAHALLVRVWSDEGHRGRFLQEPITLLNDDFGLSIDQHVVVHGRIETPHLIFVVLPCLSGYVDLATREEEFISFVNQPLIIGSQLQNTLQTCPAPCSRYTILPCR